MIGSEKEIKFQRDWHKKRETERERERERERNIAGCAFLKGLTYHYNKFLVCVNGSKKYFWTEKTEKCFENDYWIPSDKKMLSCDAVDWF